MPCRSPHTYARRHAVRPRRCERGAGRTCSQGCQCPCCTHAARRCLHHHNHVMAGQHTQAPTQCLGNQQLEEARGATERAPHTSNHKAKRQAVALKGNSARMDLCKNAYPSPEQVWGIVIMYAPTLNKAGAVGYSKLFLRSCAQHKLQHFPLCALVFCYSPPHLQTMSLSFLTCCQSSY